MHYPRLSLILCLALAPSLARASLIGDVSGVETLPGYLETRPGTAFHDGAVPRTEYWDPIERRTPSQIVAALFSNDRLNPAAIEEYLVKFRGYLDTAYLIECQDETDQAVEAVCDADPQFQKKWAKESTKLAMDFAIAELRWVLANAGPVRLSEINDAKNREWVRRLFTVLELWEGIQAEDEQRGRGTPQTRMVMNSKAILEKIDIHADRPDAANLLVPPGHPLYGKQTFLSEADLAALKAQGQDLSRLNPPSSGMWRKPKKPIRTFDTANYDGEGHERIRRLYSEEETRAITDPDQEISVTYKPHEFTGGATPKFDVYIGDHKWKLKFITNRHAYKGYTNVISEIVKTVTGSEVNVEPAVNNLAAALGFTVDPTYYKKKVRVYFQDKVYAENRFDAALKEMDRALNARYLPTVNISTALKDIKTDANGRKYIEIKSVTLEQKSHEETDMNLGFFDRLSLGKDLAREHRAFYLFMAWVADCDTKNDNTKVKLVPSGDSYKVMLSNSDMGSSFGLGYPNIYNFKLIKQVFREADGTVSGFRMNHLRIFYTDQLHAVNFNDARWFGRLLAQLTLPQLERAFRYSGYAEVIARYYARMAAGKRNELLQVLGLMGTEFTNDQGETVKVEPLPEFTGTIPGYERFFKDGLLTDPNDELQNPAIENWPRRWGVSRRLFSQDEKTDKEFRVALRNTVASYVLKYGHSLFLDRAIYHKGGLEYTRPRLIDHNLGVDCGQDCFVQGADYGVRNFVPMRFLVENPELKKDPKHPLWIVDLMRIGFFVGDRGEILQGLIGFDAPQGAAFAAGSRVFKIFEIARVTPVSGMDEYFHEGKNLSTLPKYALKGLRDQLLRDLDEGGSLVVTSYFGLEAKTRLRWAGFPWNLAGARAGVNLVKASRVTVHKRASEFWVNWDKQKSTTVSAALNLLDLVVKIPLVNQKWNRVSEKERTFIFKASERDTMNEHLSHGADDEALEDYRWETRDRQTRERSFLGSLFTKSKYRRTLRKSTVDYENFIKNTESHIKRVSMEVEKRRLVDVQDASWTKAGEMLVNDNGETGVAIKFWFSFPGATGPAFAELVRMNESYYPKSLLFFDLNYVKHYMGEVTSKSELILTQAMLEKIFSDGWSPESLCAAEPEYACSGRFWRLYSNARDNFRKVRDKGYDVRYHAMKRVVKFLILHDSLDVVGWVKRVIGGSDLIESGEFVSSLSAFPGDHTTVDYESKEEAPESFDRLRFDPVLFSDSIRRALAAVFFAPEI